MADNIKELLNVIATSKTPTELNDEVRLTEITLEETDKADFAKLYKKTSTGVYVDENTKTYSILTANDYFVLRLPELDMYRIDDTWRNILGGEISMGNMNEDIRAYIEENPTVCFIFSGAKDSIGNNDEQRNSLIKKMPSNARAMCGFYRGGVKKTQKIEGTLPLYTFIGSLKYHGCIKTSIELDSSTCDEEIYMFCE